MATSPPTKVLPTAPTGSSGWVLEAKGKDPGSLNISRDISAGANQSITVRPGTQFRMKPSGKSKVDKGAETAETAKWGDDLLVTVPGGGQVLLKGFYNKSPNAPPSKMVIEQKNGVLRKVEGRPGAEPSDSPNPFAQEDKNSNGAAGGGVEKGGKPYQEGGYRRNSEKVAKKDKKKSDDEEESSGGFFSWFTVGGSSSLGTLGLLGLSSAKKKSDSSSSANVTIDSVAPTVSSVAITSATGAQNNYLNAGDVVTTTATFSEAVTVVTTGGTPYLNLNINGTTVQAAYASGSGSTALTFSYTILAGQTDVNGISIDGNSLNLNSGTIKDASGNSATLTHSAVTDNASYMVDTTAPTATLTAATYANTASATVQSSETGTAYLVNSNVSVTNEASITSAAGTSWNSVAISAAGTNTLLSLSGLVDGSYKLYTVDAAGNLSTASTNTLTVNAAVQPIVIDLNHDGSFNYGYVVMDVNGDGLLDVTRWVGGQDGVLVWDKYHDGLVHDNSQYAFAQYDNMSAAQGKTATDLSGLAAAFDTNHDGVFDVQDAQFADFNVWQDANQDGVSDAGEVKTLAELGLSSFQLSSDGVVRTPEVGVHEAGRTSASTTDGSQVLVADVGFDFGTLAKLDLSADPVANTLALHLDDLLANPHLTLVVQGAANDAVKLQGDGWVNSGSTVTLGDHHYTVWNNSTAQLLIDQQLVNNGRVL